MENVRVFVGTLRSRLSLPGRERDQEPTIGPMYPTLTHREYREYHALLALPRKLSLIRAEKFPDAEELPPRRPRSFVPPHRYSSAPVMTSSTPRPRPSLRNLASTMKVKSTPTMQATESEDLQVGDVVSVPGDMDGVVKYVGEVKGKSGIFAGVELNKKWASRGKNDGEADGVRYFTTTITRAGIFLPASRAIKRSSPAVSSAFSPPTPNTPSIAEESFHTYKALTPPTPSLPPKFSQSVGPGRAQSPVFRPKSRPSLPRPESPLRRAQNASQNTPGGRTSLNMLSHNRLAGPRYAPSPTPGKTLGRAPSKSTSNFASPAPPRANIHGPLKEDDRDDEVAQLRAVIQEKNQKIAELTADFDSHRADFRSTLDTLELASSETERVYEGRVEELLEERRVLLAQSEDVESVAQQLRQLEEVVQELEEGLEDARRGEAEARGEVEFLRGEVERVRAELRREKERNSIDMLPEVSEMHQINEMDDLESGEPQWCALCEGTGHDSIHCPYDKS